VQSEPTAVEPLAPAPADPSGPGTAPVGCGSRRLLPNHVPHVDSTTLGKGAVPIGATVFLAGALLVLAALDVIHADDASFNGSRDVAVMVGSVMAVIGALVTAGGLRGRTRWHRLETARARAPFAPWEYDRPWRRTGERRTGWEPVVKTAGALALVELFLVPFHFVVFGGDEAPLIVKAVIVLFDVVVTLGLVYVLKRALEALRYGATHLCFERFPYPPGARLRVGFGFDRAAPRFDRLTATLRAIEAETQSSGSGEDQTVRTVLYALFEQERVYVEPSAMPGPGRDVWLEFDVPRDAPGTRLDVTVPIYWELQIRGAAPGVDFEGTYLVPVYSIR
jgi:hypothetical protein